MTDGATPEKTIAFQGEPGANSHIACREAFPDMVDLPCDTFEDVFAAVNEGRARFGMIAIENSLAGRVADVHHLIPGAGLYIVGEHFLPVRHQLLGLKGARIENLKSAHSHVHALGQCRRVIRELGLKAVVAADTAGAARQIAEAGDPARAAIATGLAAEIYGLEILRANVEDAEHNTTRFLIMAKEPNDAEPEDEPVVTSFIFRVRNVPAALYKALGGFATNGVNMTKLESYQLEGTFNASQFYADIEGHPASRHVRLALEELEFFTSELRILGVYKAHPYRATVVAGD
ncbi:MAG: prephenate dehydratase [Parvibaculum sp.]|uniref:prephenate dehydratase n=1 Tax=Parvibaculum sp. TaxID=2024848 RepID=UPI0027242FD2|nr:prephenate dehydratase [Parvibaculum sp.]MDO8839138.1 prephenate dehydratase [Parvibaculum sp.]MDP2122852.1 prephenate dehydratase [Parvibaculum sp.]